MQDLNLLDKVKDKILLIGPGISLNELDPTVLEKVPSLYFGPSFHWFEKNNVFPTYWTFFDPNTITFFDSLINGLSDYDKHDKSRYDYNNLILYTKNTPKYSEKFLTGLKNSTTLLYNDLQESKRFYDVGFTTSRGPKWFEGNYQNDILPRVKSYFATTIKFNQHFKNPRSNDYDLLYNSNINSVPLIYPVDKFSCYIIPLVIALCPELKHIECVGFGDFDNDRLSDNSGGSKGYDSFKSSFNSQKPGLIKLFKHKNITMSFYNKNSYYKELEGMDKITFCIPSKTNLRYLKTCIPSIRKNAYRDDHEIIVFVDSDEDGTIEWLDSVKDEYNVSYYVNPDLGNSLYGIGRAYDYCIEKSTTDIFMIFHADMMLGKHADLKAFNHLKEKTVVCSTRIEPPIHPNGGEKILLDFGMWPEEFKEAEFDQYVNKHLEDDKTTEGIFAPWMMYKSEFLNILGGHDPIMHSCREDSDLFNRMYLAGFTFVQPWNSLVYHLTGRGAGSFDGDPERHKKWQEDMNKSTLEFIRKWGTNVNHTPLMKPIVYPKYNIAFRVHNESPQLINTLEPWCGTLYCNINSDIDKIKPLQAELYDDFEGIVVVIDGNTFNQQDFNIIQQLSAILQDSGEIGEFQLGNLKINIGNLETSEKDFIFINK